jgi:hypothetical protein
MKYIILIVLGLIVAIEYAYTVERKKADKEAEELYKKYKEWKEHE